MSRGRHLSFRNLLDMAEGRRSSRTRLRTAHLSRCAHCQARVAKLEAVVKSIRQGDAGDAPDLWQARAMLRQARPARTEPMGHIEADIVRDSDRYVQTGTRSSVAADRHWLLVAGRSEIEVTLLGSSAEARWALSGQLFVEEGGAASMRGATVTLIEDGVERERAELFPTGEFLLRSRPRSLCRLHFEGPGWSVVTPPLAP